MKKTLSTLLIISSFVVFIPTTQAFWGFDRVTNFFRNLFSFGPAVEEQIEKRTVVLPSSNSKNGIELSFEDDPEKSDEERLEVIEAALREAQNLPNPEPKPIQEPITEPKITPPKATPEPIPGQFGCETIITEFAPTQGEYFATLPNGSQRRHTEILRYQIKWGPDKSWSDWFVPGKNDANNENDNQFWAYFGDHSYRVEHCRNYQYSPPNL